VLQPKPGASSAPNAPIFGPVHPVAVTDLGDVVRYPRLGSVDRSGTFVMDVVDPATMKVRRTITLRLNTAGGPILPSAQAQALLTLGDRLYLTASWNGTFGLVPVSLSGGTQAGRLVPVTNPGSQPAVGSPPAAVDWQSVAALPGQGLVYRAPGNGSDDVFAVDPATGRSHLLTRIPEQSPMSLAALAPSRA
jgi:hypothetical protein